MPDSAGWVGIAVRDGVRWVAMRVVGDGKRFETLMCFMTRGW